MKRLFCTLMIMACACLFVACGSSGKDTDMPPTFVPSESPKNDNSEKDEENRGDDEKNDEWFDIDL